MLNWFKRKNTLTLTKQEVKDLVKGMGTFYNHLPFYMTPELKSKLMKFAYDTEKYNEIVNRDFDQLKFFTTPDKEQENE